MFKRLVIFLGLGLALLFVAQTAAAQQGQPTDDDVNRIARQLYCPVCENIPLDVCNTIACAEWRDTIREKLALGWGEQQIMDYFVTLYGERVLARPSTNGLTLFIWVLPPLAVVGGAFAWWRFLRSSARPNAAPAEPAQPSIEDQDPYLQRMEQELRRARRAGGAS